MEPIEYEIKNKKLSEKEGYLYFNDGSHPLSYSCSIVYLHRHIASIKLGRWLTKNEVVHHVDGNKKNNDLENLIILTKSEHARLHKNNNYDFKIYEFTCPVCKIVFKTKNVNRTYCSPPCSTAASKRFDITADELHKEVWSAPMTRVAKKYGVSDKAIKKRCKRLGIESPPQGYWIRSKK